MNAAYIRLKRKSDKDRDQIEANEHKILSSIFPVASLLCLPDFLFVSVHNRPPEHLSFQLFLQLLVLLFFLLPFSLPFQRLSVCIHAGSWGAACGVKCVKRHCIGTSGEVERRVVWTRALRNWRKLHYWRVRVGSALPYWRHRCTGVRAAFFLELTTLSIESYR